MTRNMKRCVNAQALITLAIVWQACTSSPTAIDHTTHAPAATPAVASIMLSETQLRLGNITTGTVHVKGVGQTLALSGALTVDENKSAVIGSRAPGRIDHLYAKETGHMIQQGQPLYTIYSEMLLTLQREYLLAREQFKQLGAAEPRYESFMKSAANKLLRYGLTEKQISQLATTGVQTGVTIVSPVSGLITDIAVEEGSYVAEGTTLYRVEDVRSLWVEAELYPQETDRVRTDDTILVRVSGYETHPVAARVIFLSPEYRSGTQIVVMRAELPNPDNRFKPGMQVQVLLTHSAKQALAVPRDAVIRSGKGAHLYVMTAANTFTPRVVQTGIENFNDIEILHGLREGETIAATGAYLLYSELVLKKGIDPMQPAKSVAPPKHH